MEGKCVFLTEESSLRGIDFKLSEKFKQSTVYIPRQGIGLCMTATVSSPRAYIQAAGRVGRYTESCGRYQLSGFEAYKMD